MLDSFLKVACARTKEVQERENLVSAMRELPEDYLHKLASGEEKLAYITGDMCWLDKFKGTPLLAQAIELEKQDLEQQMAENTRMREEDQVRSDRNAARDEIAVHRRLLELQLAEHEAGGSAEAVEPAGEEEPAAFGGEETPEEEALEHGDGSPEVAAAEAGLPPHGGMETPEEEAAEGLPLAGAAPPDAAGVEVEGPVEEGALPPKKKEEKKPEAEKAAAARLASAMTTLSMADGDLKVAAALHKSIGRAFKSGVETLKGTRVEKARKAGIKFMEGADFAKKTPVFAKSAPRYERAAKRTADIFNKEKGKTTKARKGVAIAGATAALGGVAAHKSKRSDKEKKAEALFKEAIGLGSLGTAVAGGAKNIFNAGSTAFNAARAGGMGGALKAGLGAAGTAATPALKTMGRAGMSYAKANPAAAAGLAGAGALGAYGAYRGTKSMLGGDE